MKKLLAITVAATMLFTACNSYQKTPSGMPYKITKGPRKQKLANGQYLKMNFEYKLKDSVISSTYGHIPIYFQIDTTRNSAYSFAEVMTDCYVGDRLDCTLSIDSMVKKGVLMYNPIFKKGDFITCKVEFLKIFTDEAEQEKDFQQELTAEKQREDKGVKDYAAKKKYQPIYSSNGVGVVIENVGDTSAKLVAGKEAAIYYTGRLMNNEKEFDSNIKNGVKGEAFNFIVDSKSTIPGFEEGLKYFAKGGKGILLIPATQAYGAQGSAPVIPPYSNLIFEVEIADVKDAPKQVTPPTPAPTEIVKPQKKQIQKQQ
mgnify:CR=1 FL=1